MDLAESVHDISELSIDIVICLSLNSLNGIPDPADHVNAKFVFDGIVGKAVMRV